MVTLFEIALGPLPATLVLTPFATGSALGSGLAIATILADRTTPFSTRLAMLLVPGGMILWILSAGVGLSALWVAVLIRQSGVFLSSRALGTLIVGLLVGMVAAPSWLFMMVLGRERFDIWTWATWIGLLAGPILVGARHLFLLIMRPRRAA